MPEYHDRFRGNSKSFAKLLETYEALAEMQVTEPRLRIHSISTVTSENLDEIKRLTTYLYERCPAMDHHNLALIRGERKNKSLVLPDLRAYDELYQYARRLWAPREEKRYGSLVEPMLQWAKVKTAQQETQVIPCRAGVLSGVVYANGDVSFCEMHPPIGNLRQKSFPRDLALARGAGAAPQRSAPRNAGAPTKSSCGRASTTSRYTLPKRCSARGPGPRRTSSTTPNAWPCLPRPARRHRIRN